jgi:hypothetical protein
VPFCLLALDMAQRRILSLMDVVFCFLSKSVGFGSWFDCLSLMDVVFCFLSKSVDFGSWFD